MTMPPSFVEHPGVVAVAALHVLALAVSTLGLLPSRQAGGPVGRRALARVGVGLLALAFAANTWWLADRWVEAGRPPFKTLFETLLFYPWCVAGVTLVFVAVHRLFVIVPFAAAISCFGLAYALWKPDAEIVLLPPALQSAWFVPHVITYFLAYAALFLSAVLALLALLSRRGGFEAHAHRAAVFGVGALSIGLFLGGVWAKYAWGDWWSWDPKENWALATWLAYVIYLHLRLLEGWHGRRAMWGLLVSFAAVVFTYLGMSLLPTVEGSLHAYG